MKPASRSTIDPGFLHILALLRWYAAAGRQALAIAVTLYPLGLPPPAWPLWAGVAALLAFNVWAMSVAPGIGRAADPAAAAVRPAIAAGVAVGHLAFDIAELTWAIAWSGGPMLAARDVARDRAPARTGGACRAHPRPRDSRGGRGACCEHAVGNVDAAAR